MNFAKTLSFLTLYALGWGISTSSWGANSAASTIKTLIAGNANSFKWGENTTITSTSNYSVINAIKSIYNIVKTDDPNKIRPILTISINNYEPVDNEWSPSLYGHLLKAVQLLDQLIENTSIDCDYYSINSYFSYSDEQTQYHTKLCSCINYYITKGRQSLCTQSIVGNPSESGWTSNDTTGTFFARVNFILEELRKPTSSPLTFTNLDENLAQVEALVYTGSRGYSKSLFEAIKGKTSPTEVLEDKTVWGLIFGSPTDQASASGTLWEQVNFWAAEHATEAATTLGTLLGSEVNDTLKECNLQSALAKIHQALGEHATLPNAPDIYKLLTPATADDAKKLDFLSKDTMAASASYKDLTLQTALIYLLADTKANFLTDTHRTDLLKILATRCQQIFALCDSGPSCCKNSAHYASDLATTLKNLANSLSDAGPFSTHDGFLTLFDTSLNKALEAFTSEDSPTHHSLADLLRITSNTLKGCTLDTAADDTTKFSKENPPCTALLAHLAAINQALPGLHQRIQPQLWEALLEAATSPASLGGKLLSFASSLSTWQAALAPGGALYSALVCWAPSNGEESSPYTCATAPGVGPCETCNNPETGEPIGTYLSALAEQLETFVPFYKVAQDLLTELSQAEALLRLQETITSWLEASPSDALERLKALPEPANLQAWAVHLSSETFPFSDWLDTLGLKDIPFEDRANRLHQALLDRLSEGTKDIPVFTGEAHDSDLALWSAFNEALTTLGAAATGDNASDDTALLLQLLQAPINQRLQDLSLHLCTLPVRQALTQAVHDVSAFVEELVSPSSQSILPLLSENPFSYLEGTITTSTLTQFFSAFSRSLGSGSLIDGTGAPLSALVPAFVQAFHDLEQALRTVFKKIFLEEDGWSEAPGLNEALLKSLYDFQKNATKFLESAVLDDPIVLAPCACEEYRLAAQSLDKDALLTLNEALESDLAAHLLSGFVEPLVSLRSTFSALDASQRAFTTAEGSSLVEQLSRLLDTLPDSWPTVEDLQSPLAALAEILGTTLNHQDDGKQDDDEKAVIAPYLDAYFPSADNPNGLAPLLDNLQQQLENWTTLAACFNQLALAHPVDVAFLGQLQQLFEALSSGFGTLSLSFEPYARVKDFLDALKSQAQTFAQSLAEPKVYAEKHLCSKAFSASLQQGFEAVSTFSRALKEGTPAPLGASRPLFQALQNALHHNDEEQLLKALGDFWALFAEPSASSEEATLAPLSDLVTQLLQAFESLPAALYDVLSQDPKGTKLTASLLDSLEAFQEEAASFELFWKGITGAGFCGWKGFEEIGLQLTVPTLQNLRHQLDRALSEIRKAQHTCSLKDKLSHLQAQLQALESSLSRLSFEEALANDGFASFVALSAPQFDTESPVAWAQSATQALLILFGQGEEFLAPSPTISLVQMSSPTSTLLSWIQGLDSQAARSPQPRPQLADQLTVLGERLRDAALAYPSSLLGKPFANCALRDLSAYDLNNLFDTLCRGFQAASQLCFSLAQESRLCPSCQNLISSVQNLDSRLETTQQLFGALASWVATEHTPDYEALERLRLCLTPWNVENLSCEKAQAVDGLTEQLERLNTVLTALLPQVPSLSASAPLALQDLSSGLALDVLAVRILASTKTLADHIHQLFLNIHAPPLGHWQALDSLQTAAQAFLSSLEETLSSVVFCKVCDEASSSLLFQDLHSMLDGLSFTLEPLFSAWQHYADRDTLAKALETVLNTQALFLHSLDSLEKAPDLASTLDAFDGFEAFLNAFSNLNDFKKEVLPEPLQLLWQTNTSLEPTLSSLQEALYRGEDLPRALLPVLRQLQARLLQAHPVLNKATLATLAYLETFQRSLTDFAKKLQEPLTLSLQNGILQLTIGEGLWSSVIGVVQQVLEEVAARPSCCQELLALLQQSDVQLQTLESQVLVGLDSEDFDQLLETLLQLLPSKEPHCCAFDVPQNGSPDSRPEFVQASCEDVSLWLHKIAQRSNRLRQLWETWSQRDIDALPESRWEPCQATLRRVRRALASLSQALEESLNKVDQSLANGTFCPFCNPLAFKGSLTACQEQITKVDTVVTAVSDEVRHLPLKKRVEALQAFDLFVAKATAFGARQISFLTDSVVSPEQREEHGLIFASALLSLQNDVALALAAWAAQPEASALAQQALEQCQRWCENTGATLISTTPISTIQVSAIPVNLAALPTHLDEPLSSLLFHLEDFTMTMKHIYTTYLTSTTRFPSALWSRNLNTFAELLRSLSPPTWGPETLISEEHQRALQANLNVAAQTSEDIASLPPTCCVEKAKIFEAFVAQTGSLRQNLALLNQQGDLVSLLKGLRDDEVLDLFTPLTLFMGAQLQPDRDAGRALKAVASVVLNITQRGVGGSAVELDVPLLPLPPDCSSLSVLATRYVQNVTAMAAELQSLAATCRRLIEVQVSPGLLQKLEEMLTLLPCFEALYATNGSCEDCAKEGFHGGPPEESLYQEALKAHVAPIETAFLSIISELKGKCCVRESEAWHELAQTLAIVVQSLGSVTAETWTQATFTPTLQRSLETWLAALQNSPPGSTPWNFGAHHATESLQRLHAHLAAFSEEFCLLFGTPTLPFALEVAAFGCQQKGADGLWIQQSLDKATTEILRLEKELSAGVVTFQPEAQLFVQTLCNIVDLLRTLSPLEVSDCAACKVWLPAGQLTSLCDQPLASLGQALSQLDECLKNPTCCQKETEQILALLTAFDASQTPLQTLVQSLLSAQEPEKIYTEPLLENDLSTLKKINTLLSVGQGSVEDLQKITKSLTKQADFITQLAPELVVEPLPSLDTEAVERDPLSYLLTHLAQSLNNQTDRLLQLQNLWTNTPPEATETKVCLFETLGDELQTLILLASNHVNHFWGHLALCPLTPKPLEALKTTFLDALRAHKVRVDALGTLLKEVLFQKSLRGVLPVAKALEQLTYVLHHLAFDPVTETEIDGKMVPIAHTTRLNNLVTLWGRDLRHLERQLPNSSEATADPEAIAQALAALAQNLWEAYLQLKGTEEPLPQSCIATEVATLSASSLSSLIVSYVQDITGSLRQIIQGFVERPFSVYAPFQEALATTRDVLQVAAAFLRQDSTTPATLSGFTQLGSIALLPLADFCSQILPRLSVPMCDSALATQVDELRRYVVASANELQTFVRVLGANKEKLDSISSGTQPVRTNFLSDLASVLGTSSYGNVVSSFSAFVDQATASKFEELLCENGEAIKALANLLYQPLPGSLRRLAMKLDDSLKTWSTSEYPAALPSDLSSVLRVQWSLTEIARALQEVALPAFEALTLHTKETFDTPHNAIHLEHLERIQTFWATLVGKVEELHQGPRHLCSSLQEDGLLSVSLTSCRRMKTLLGDLVLNVKQRPLVTVAKALDSFVTSIKNHTLFIQTLSQRQETLSTREVQNLETYLSSLYGSLQKTTIGKDYTANIELFQEDLNEIPYSKGLVDELNNITTLFNQTPPAQVVWESSGSPLERISAALGEFFNELALQAASLRKLTDLELETGSTTLDETLTRLSQIVTPKETPGLIATFFQQIVQACQAYAVNYASALPYEGEIDEDLDSQLTTLSEALLALRAVVQVEKCSLLAEQYTNILVPALLSIGQNIQAFITEPRSASASRTALLKEILEQWTSPDQGFLRVFRDLLSELKITFSKNHSKDYCYAGLVSRYTFSLQERLNAINRAFENQGISPKTVVPYQLPDTVQGTCQSLHIAREALLLAIQGLETALCQGTDALQTYGPQELLTDEDRTTLSLLQQKMLDLNTVFATLRSGLPVLCTACNTSSADFLQKLMTKVEAVHAGLFHLTDAAAKFCCCSSHEPSWRKIQEGVHGWIARFQKTLSEAFVDATEPQAFDTPEHPLTRELQTTITFIQELPRILTPLVNTDPHDEAYGTHLKALAEAFAPFAIQKGAPLQPWSSDMLHHVREGLLCALQQLPVSLQAFSASLSQHTFLKNRHLTTLFDETAESLATLAQLISGPLSGHEPSHRQSTTQSFRQQLRNLWTSCQQLCRDISRQLQAPTAEDEVKKELARTAAIMDLSRQLFGHVGSDSSAEALKEAVSSLYSTLLRLKPQQVPEEPRAADTFILHLLKAWEQFQATSTATTLETLRAALAAFNGCVYQHLHQALHTFANVEETLPPAASLSPVGATLSLTHIAHSCASLAQTVLHFALHLPATSTWEEIARFLTPDDSFLAFLGSLAEPVQHLANGLAATPHTLYDSAEWALILSSLKSSFLDTQQARGALQNRFNRQEAIKANAESLAYLQALRQLTAFAESLPLQASWPKLDSLFESLAIWAEDLSSYPSTKDLENLSASLSDALGSSPQWDTALPFEPETLAGLISQERDLLVSRVQNLLEAWQEPAASCFHERSLLALQTFLERMEGHLSTEGAPFRALLGSFLDVLLKPHCCDNVAVSLTSLEASLSSFVATAQTLERATTLPDLSNEERAALNNHLAQMVPHVATLASLCHKVPTLDCLETSFLRDIAQFAETTQALQEEFSALVARLLRTPQADFVPVPLKEDFSCTRTEVLLTRCIHNFQALARHLNHSVTLFQPQAGQARPYPAQTLALLQNEFLPLFENITLFWQAQRVAYNGQGLCLNHSVLLPIKNLDESLVAWTDLASSLSLLIRNLQALKESQLSEAVHNFQTALSSLHSLLSSLEANLEDILPSVGASSLPEILESLQTLWFQSAENITPHELTQSNALRDHFAQGATLLENAVLQLQALCPTWRLPKIPAVVYNEDQREQDLAIIKQELRGITRLLKEVFAPILLEHRGASVPLSRVFSALENLYVSYSLRDDLLVTKDPAVTKLLSYYDFADLDVPLQDVALTCHHIAFALANTTCCESQLDLLDTLGTTYTDLLNRLDLVTQGKGLPAQEPIPDMTPDDLIEGIISKITDLVGLAQEGTLCLQTCSIRLRALDVHTCFTEQDPLVFSSLKDWTGVLKAMAQHLTTLPQYRARLYDLSDESSSSFATLGEQFLRLAPYYNGNVAQQWSALNEALASQILEFQHLLAELNQHKMCQFNDANGEYAAKLSVFSTLPSILQSSQQALEAYQQACCLQNARSLVKIDQQLVHLSKLKSILFRNPTFPGAEKLLSSLQVTLSKAGELLKELPSLAPHSPARLSALEALGNELQHFNEQLDQYGTAYDVSFPVVVLPEPQDDYTQALSHLATTWSTTLTKDWAEWYLTLAAEDGLNQNERCFSELAGKIVPLLGSLHNLFQSWSSDETTARQLFCSTLSLENLMPLCGTLANGSETLQQTLREIHQLLTAPTCCRSRALVGQELALEFTSLRNIVSGALQALGEKDFAQGLEDPDLFTKTFHQTAQLLTAWSVHLGEITATPHFVCQSASIRERLNRPCLTTLQALVKTLQPAFALWGDPLEDTAPAFDTNHGCVALPQVTSYLSTVAESLKKDLTLFNQRLEKRAPFPYHNGVLMALKEALDAVVQLNASWGRFFVSCEASCVSCQSHTNTPLLTHLQGLVPTLERMKQLLNLNRIRRHVQQFHHFVEAASRLTQRLCFVWAPETEALMEPSRLPFRKDLLTALNATFSGLIPQLGKLAALPASSIELPFSPALEDMYSASASLLQEGTRLIDEALVREGLTDEKPSGSESALDPSYGPELLTTDAHRLYVFCQNMTQLFLRKVESVQETDFYLSGAWQEHQSLTEKLAQALAASLSASSWAQTPFLKDLALPDLQMALRDLLQAQKNYTAAIQTPPLCEHTLTPLRQVVDELQTLTSMFPKDLTVFQRDLTDGEHSTFLETTEALLEPLITFVEHIQQLATSDDVPDVVYTCVLNPAFETLLEDGRRFQAVLRPILAVFSPVTTFALPESEPLAQRPLLLRHLVQNLNHLRQTVKASFVQASLCPVRTYRSDSIARLEEVRALFHRVQEQIPLTFSLITPCLASEDTEERLILSEIQPCLVNMERDLDDLILTLKKTCCSRLTYRLFQLADELDLLQQGVVVLVQHPALAETFLSTEFNEQAATWVESIARHHLTDWENMFVKREETETETATTPLACSDEAPLAFLDNWLAILSQLNSSLQGTLKEQLPQPLSSSVEHPHVYVCPHIPAVLQACSESLNRISTSLTMALSKLHDTKFVYSKVYNTYVFLLRCSQALTNLSELSPSLPPLTEGRCPFCPETLITTAQTLLASTRTEWRDLLAHLEDLRTLLFAYCQDEVAFALHRYNEDLHVLLTVFDPEAPQMADQWHDRLMNDTSILTSLHNAYEYGIPESLNTLLAEVTKLQPIEGICQMIQLIPLANSMQEKFSHVVKTLAQLTGTPYNEASQPLVLGTLSWVHEQACYAQNIQALTLNLSKIFNAISALEEIWPTRVSKQLTNIVADLNERSALLKAWYAQWKQAPLCPHMPVCVCNGCDVCEHEEDCTDCIPCDDTCTTCNNVEKPWRYALWQSVQALSVLEATIIHFSSTLISSCCQKAYQPLFKMLKPLSDFVAYFETLSGVESLQSTDKILTFANLLYTTFSLFEERFASLETACSQARALPEGKCRMNNLFAPILQLYLVFQDYVADDDEEFFDNSTSSGLLQRYSNFLTQMGIALPVLEEFGTYNYYCAEIDYLLPVFEKFFSRLGKALHKLTTQLSTEDHPDAVLQSYLTQTYFALNNCAQHVQTLMITTSPLCRSCSIEIINSFVESLSKLFLSMADDVLSLRNSVNEAYCCVPYEMVLTESVRILTSVTSNIHLLVEVLPAQDVVVLWSPTAAFDNLAQGIDDIDTDFSHYLSARHQLPDIDVLVPCYADKLIPYLLNINSSLQKSLYPAVEDCLTMFDVDQARWAALSDEPQHLDLISALEALAQLLGNCRASVVQFTENLWAAPLPAAPHPAFVEGLGVLTRSVGQFVDHLSELHHLGSLKSFCAYEDNVPALGRLASFGGDLLQELITLGQQLELYLDLDIIRGLQRGDQAMALLAETCASLAWLPLEDFVNGPTTPSFLSYLYTAHEALSEIDSNLVGIIEPGSIESASRQAWAKHVNRSTAALQHMATAAQQLSTAATDRPVLPPPATSWPTDETSLLTALSAARERGQGHLEVLHDAFQLMAERCLALGVTAADERVLSSIECLIQLLEYIHQSLDVLWSDVADYATAFVEQLPELWDLNPVINALKKLSTSLTPRPIQRRWVDTVNKWTSQLVSHAEILVSVVKAAIPENMDPSELASAALTVVQSLAELAPWLQGFVDRMETSRRYPALLENIIVNALEPNPFGKIKDAIDRLAQLFEVTSRTVHTVHTANGNRCLRSFSHAVTSMSSRLPLLGLKLTDTAAVSPQMIDTNELLSSTFELIDIDSLIVRMSDLVKDSEVGDELHTVEFSSRIMWRSLAKTVSTWLDAQSQSLSSRLSGQTQTLSPLKGNQTPLAEVAALERDVHGVPLREWDGQIIVSKESLLGRAADVINY